MRKVPIKNYILLGILVIFTILLTLYINEWIKTFKVNKSNTSPLVSMISQVNKDELHMSLTESNQIILYVGYNHDKSVNKLEKELLKTIKNENLNEYVIYYDVTEDKEYLNILRKEFNDKSSLINKAPLLIYVKNGEAIDVKDSKESLITLKDFKELIETYEIGK